MELKCLTHSQNAEYVMQILFPSMAHQGGGWNMTPCFNWELLVVTVLQKIQYRNQENKKYLNSGEHYLSHIIKVSINRDKSRRLYALKIG